MKLTVVIVNYNVKYFLEQALYSVRRASQKLEVEVYVVDNTSVDGSNEMVREKFPEVKLIANKENVGFSVANNQAIRESKGEYVLLLN
ncbi:MAG: GT2 family glycosyltransferase, partial [Sphingobacteriales bacterium]